MKNIFLIVILLISTITFSQKKNYNQFSADFNFGMSLPITPIPDGRKAGDFNGYSHFELGTRYMILPEIGVKLSYAHEKFQDKNIKSNDLVYNSFKLQAVSNLVYLFGFEGDLWDSVGLLAHAGGGITFANPIAAENNEKVGSLIFGISPLYRLGDKFAVNADFSYTLTTKQHFGFDGQLIEPNFPSDEGFEAFTGGYVNISVGIIYYIGKNIDHADWL